MVPERKVIRANILDRPLAPIPELDAGTPQDWYAYLTFRGLSRPRAPDPAPNGP